MRMTQDKEKHKRRTNSLSNESSSHANNHHNNMNHHNDNNNNNNNNCTVAGASNTEDHIRCCIRIRPMNKNEMARNDQSVLHILRDHQTLQFISSSSTPNKRSRANSAATSNSSNNTNKNKNTPRNAITKAAQKLNQQQQQQQQASDKGIKRTFTFDYIMDESTSQDRVFEQSGVRELIDFALEGYSTTIFAYGQTGSGKTFTITGEETSNQLNGLLPRCTDYIFAKISQLSHYSKTQFGFETSYKIRTSYLEIWNEQINDLLNLSATNLPVRWSNKDGFFVENLFVVQCSDSEDVRAVIAEGISNRRVAAHDLNKDSSRSHSIFTIYIDIVISDDSNGSGNNSNSHTMRKHGKIQIVDLAGSERLKESNSSGGTAVETGHINKSLLTLGKVINTLGDPKRNNGSNNNNNNNMSTHVPSSTSSSSSASTPDGSRTGNHNNSNYVPYRDSKLTKLLMDSLGGTSKTLMIACITPSSIYADETLNTLKYANRVKNIKNKPIVHMDPQEAYVLELKEQIRLLKDELSQAKQQQPQQGFLPIHSPSMVSSQQQPTVQRYPPAGIQIVSIQQQNEEHQFKLPPIHGSRSSFGGNSVNSSPSNMPSTTTSSSSFQPNFNPFSPTSLIHSSHNTTTTTTTAVNSNNPHSMISYNIPLSNPLYPKEEKKKISSGIVRELTPPLSTSNQQLQLLHQQQQQKQVISFTPSTSSHIPTYISSVNSSWDRGVPVSKYPVMDPQYATLIAQKERMEVEIKDLKSTLERYQQQQQQTQDQHLRTNFSEQDATRLKQENIQLTNAIHQLKMNMEEMKRTRKDQKLGNNDSSTHQSPTPQLFNFKEEVLERTQQRELKELRFENEQLRRLLEEHHISIPNSIFMKTSDDIENDHIDTSRKRIYSGQKSRSNSSRSRNTTTSSSSEDQENNSSTRTTYVGVDGTDNDNRRKPERPRPRRQPMIEPFGVVSVLGRMIHKAREVSSHHKLSEEHRQSGDLEQHNSEQSKSEETTVVHSLPHQQDNSIHHPPPHYDDHESYEPVNLVDTTNSAPNTENRSRSSSRGSVHSFKQLLREEEEDFSTFEETTYETMETDIHEASTPIDEVVFAGEEDHEIINEHLVQEEEKKDDEQEVLPELSSSSFLLPETQGANSDESQHTMKEESVTSEEVEADANNDSQSAVLATDDAEILPSTETEDNSTRELEEEALQSMQESLDERASLFAQDDVQ